MRTAFGLAGLALSVVAIGACDEPDYKYTDPLTCAAYLSHLSNARTELRVPIDGAELAAASASWLARAEQKFGEPELALLMADSASWVENASAEDIEMISTACIAQAPNA